MKEIEEDLKSDETRIATIGIVKDNIRRLAKDESVELRKEIVCPYFKDSDESPECLTCFQNDEEVSTCTEDYLTLMKRVPSLIFKRDYWKNKVRPRISLKEIDFLGLNCEVCYIRDTCPERLDGAMCSIDWGNQDKQRMTPEEVLDFMIEIQTKRIARAQMFEELDGGMPDETLSKELDKLRNMNEQRIYMRQEKFSLRIEATSSGNQLGGSPQQSILQRIFGGAIGGQQQIESVKSETIDISSEEVKEKIPIKKKK